MIEKIQLGETTCDFLRWSDYMALCKQWITSNNFHHVVTLNPEMVMLAQSNEPFRRCVTQATLRVPDGAGLIWAQWYIRSQFWSLWGSLFAFSLRTVERITGVDTVRSLSSLAAQHSLPIYLLGGTSSQVSQTAAKLKKMVPGVMVHTSPNHQFDPSGPPSILADIATKRPAILLVAYGAPNQTTWIQQHQAALQAAGVRIAVGVGGAFAILSEERQRAPRPLRKLNLEWAWRLLLEPSRFPRIWAATIQFPLLIARQKNLSTAQN